MAVLRLKARGRYWPGISQSLAKIYIHLIFSTRNREPVVGDAVRLDLHAYLGGILRDVECPALELNTERDHAHVLFLLAQYAVAE